MKGAKSYIVGKGAVCALGNSLPEIVANIEVEKSGVKNGSKSYANGQSFPLGAVDGAFFSQYDIADRSAYSRLEQMMISSTLDAAKDTTVDFSSTSTLFIFSTTKGNIDNLNRSV
jgi:hypothetical protein